MDELDRYRFLAGLDDAIRPLTDPDAITRTVAARLAGYLGVDLAAPPDATPSAFLHGQWQARPWQPREAQLLAAAAGRWREALEHARMAQELRGAEARIRANHDYLRLLIDSGEEGFTRSIAPAPPSCAMRPS